MNKIVGGIDAINGRYPYMAALLVTDDFFDSYSGQYYFDDYVYYEDYSTYYDYNFNNSTNNYYDYNYYNFNYQYYYNYYNPPISPEDDDDETDIYYSDSSYTTTNYYYDSYYYFYYDPNFEPDYTYEEYNDYYLSGNPNQICGGSLISSKVVLTAAHCVDFLTPNDLQISLDCTDITNIEDCTIVNVTDIVVHPDWQVIPGTFGDDLALVFLAEEVDFDTVTLATPDINAQSGDIVRNIGWGRTVKIKTPPAGKLQEVDVSVVENDICIDQMIDIFAVYDASFEDYRSESFPYYNDYNEENYIERGNLDTVICTIGDGKSSCNGDSGGPLFYACDTEGVADIQIGVVSFGFSCGGEGVPIGFESVNSLTGFDFIVETLSDFNIDDVQFVDSFDGFCPEDPIDQLASPTPFPTFLVGAWTCDPFFFAANDGCDCGCGLPDPDCEVQSRQNILFGCNRTTEVCVEGVCTISTSIDDPSSGETNSPTVELTNDPADSGIEDLTNAPSMRPTVLSITNDTTDTDADTGDLTNAPTMGPTISLVNDTEEDSGNTTDTSSDRPTFSPTESPSAGSLIPGLDSDDGVSLGLITFLAFIGVIILGCCLFFIVKNKKEDNTEEGKIKEDVK